MNKAFSLIKWGITLGSGAQNFLGAGWIERSLGRTAPDKRRIKALELLSLSPHYFIDGDNPAYAGMDRKEYLETSFDIGRTSRERFTAEVLADRLKSSDVV